MISAPASGIRDIPGLSNKYYDLIGNQILFVLAIGASRHRAGGPALVFIV